MIYIYISLLAGVQAVAAMFIGTQTIGKIDSIAGPGNAFVVEANCIDLPAGPTGVFNRG